jgi:hypothetical protein
MDSKMEIYDRIRVHPMLSKFRDFYILMVLEEVLEDHEDESMSDSLIIELVADILENDPPT